MIWQKHDTDGILTKNPIRYRGYYYDAETGFYYLNARYYDPTVRRFISADDMRYLGADGTLTGYNLFAYCANNSIKNEDSTGHFWREIWNFISLVGTETYGTMAVMKPAFGAISVFPAVDGPLPVMDGIAVVGVVVLVGGALGYGIYKATQVQSANDQIGKEKAKEIADKIKQKMELRHKGIKVVKNIEMYPKMKEIKSYQKV